MSEEIETDGKYDHLDEDEIEELKELDEKDRDELSDAEVTSKVELSLKRKYSPQEWLLFFEVPKTKEGSGHRRIDAIAFNTFPSRNFKIIGFEIKASRSDWRKEMDEGAKADYFVGQVDEFYIVAGRKDIVRENELPQGWGLIEMKGSEKLWVEKESELTEYQDQPLDKEFFIRCMKKAYGKRGFTDQFLKEAKRRAYKEGKEEGSAGDRELRRVRRKAEKFDKLNESDLNFRSVDQDYLDDLKKAKELIDIFDDSGVYNIQGYLDKVRSKADSIKEKADQAEELVDYISQVENPEEFEEDDF